MKTALECIPCFVRQATEAVTFCVPDESRRMAILKTILAEIATMDWQGDGPRVAQRIHRRIRSETGNPDPYACLKREMNRLALDLLPSLLQEARLADDPRTATVRLAIAGNLLDAGAKSGLDEASCRAALFRACRGDCLKGGAERLFERAAQARRILYLADNAGEIVFDRALVELLPLERLTVAVRGAPVLNDATLEDAEIAGLTHLVEVLPNGSDAPGTVLDDCSPEFRHRFEECDLLIAKGQGNFESLSETTRPIFFLLQVKCACVAGHLNVPVGATVLYGRNFSGAPLHPCILT
jgi:uncharacterized protein with ATP-grasp and redox domains